MISPCQELFIFNPDFTGLIIICIYSRLIDFWIYLRMTQLDAPKIFNSNSFYGNSETGYSALFFCHGQLIHCWCLLVACDFWHSETEINLIHVQNLQLTLLRICFISIISFETISNRNHLLKNWRSIYCVWILGIWMNYWFSNKSNITKMVIFILFSSCVLENWWRQNLKGNHFCKSESQPQNYRCLTFCTMHCNNSAILSSTMYSSFVDPWI